MEASTLTPIPNRGIELAFQLQAFRSSNPGCPHVTEFDGATLDLIEFIYTHYPVPLPKASSAYNSVPPETCPLRSGERLLHPLIYPVDWPIDRSILSKAVRDFLNCVENRLRALLPFVNWQAKRPVKPSISDALGRSKIRRTKTGISDPLVSDLSPELPFVPVVPAEPFRINSGLNQSLFSYPHSNITPASRSVLPTTRIRIPSPVQAQEPPLIIPTVEATQPLHRVDHQNPSPAPSSNPFQETTESVIQPPPEIMAPITDNDDIRALLDSVNLLTQQVANMGQQITDLQHQRQPAPSSTPAPSSAPPTTTASTATNSGTSWRAADIGFFYPDMPISWGTGDVIDKEDKIYYRNVHAFTNRLKVAAQSRDVQKLSQNLDTCFRGEASRWWNDELDALTRRGLVHADNMDEWSEILQRRFKTPPGQAWSNLDNTRYTLNDVRNKKSVSAYVSSLVSAAKQCGETQEYPMVLRAWKHLDLPLRRTIDEPIEGTTIKDFMELLVRKQSNWFDTYEQRRDTRQYDYEHQQSLNRPRPNQYAGYGRTSYPPTYSGIPRYQQNFPNATRKVGTQNNPNYGTDARNNPASWQDRRQETPKSYEQRPLPTPNRPLLLTQHPYNSSKPDPRNRWHKDPQQLTPKSSTAYTATENAYAATEIPSSEGPDQESSKGSFAEAFYQGAQWAQTYSTTEPDVEPENFDDEFEDESFNSTASAYTCNICHSDFGSNNKLHTHIRAHSEDDSVQTEAYIATPMNLPSHTYAAAQTSLTVHGITETICLDTGCTMTLIDKEFLLRPDPDVDIHKRPTEITVRSFGYRVSVSVSEYVTVALHLIAKKVKIKQHHVLPHPVYTNGHTVIPPSSQTKELPNGISVYGDPETTERLRKVKGHDVI